MNNEQGGPRAKWGGGGGGKGRGAYGVWLGDLKEIDQ